MCEGSEMYFLSIDTLNIGRIRGNSSGNTNLFATSPTVDQISDGPMYLGASFPFLPNLITPFIGDIFKNTKSPAENNTSFLLGSAYFFYLLKAVFNLC